VPNPPASAPSGGGGYSATRSGRGLSSRLTNSPSSSAVYPASTIAQFTAHTSPLAGGPRDTTRPGLRSGRRSGGGRVVRLDHRDLGLGEGGLDAVARCARARRVRHGGRAVIGDGWPRW